jgi:hypothetical protein
MCLTFKWPHHLCHLSVFMDNNKQFKMNSIETVSFALLWLILHITIPHVILHFFVKVNFGCNKHSGERMWGEADRPPEHNGCIQSAEGPMELEASVSRRPSDFHHPSPLWSPECFPENKSVYRYYPQSCLVGSFSFENLTNTFPGKILLHFLVSSNFLFK